MTAVTQHSTPAAFLQTVGPHLEEHEALNNHFFGVAGAAIRGRYADSENLWLSVTEGGHIVGCALQTPPWPLAISYGATPEAVAAILALVDATEFNMSPHHEEAVEQVLGRQLTMTLGQGIYELSTVLAPTGVAGTMRAATTWDVELVARWAAAFQEDVELPDPRTELEHRRMARDVIADGSMVLWDVDGEPVSMAAARGPTPHGIRISWVFTPREHRRHGYASACVAALSQRELDRGRDFCFLFTELSNPTSNHIYQQMGYRRVGTLNRYRVA